MYKRKKRDIHTYIHTYIDYLMGYMLPAPDAEPGSITAHLGDLRLHFSLPYLKQGVSIFTLSIS